MIYIEYLGLSYIHNGEKKAKEDTVMVVEGEERTEEQ